MNYIKNISFTLLLSIILCGFNVVEAQQINPTKDWKISIQSYSFHKFSLEEALNKTQQLGVHYIEVYPGHRLGDKWGDKVFNYDMDPKIAREIKELALKKDIKIVGMGVIVPDNESQWRDIFKFAKNMDIEFISCEPDVKQWDKVEWMAKVYGVKVAVHNHPKPSYYWDPDSLLLNISSRSPLIGSCADVGHWRREGLNQIECLKKLEGRIVSLHFKDIAQKKNGESEMPDVIWGNGVLNVVDMLKELKRQNFKGYFSIEYENNWDNSVPDIEKCIKYFNEKTATL